MGSSDIKNDYKNRPTLFLKGIPRLTLKDASQL